MGSRPFMHLSRVDLPEPEGPIITTTSLLETCRSTPRSTSNEPNLLCTSSSLIMLSFSSGLHPCHSACLLYTSDAADDLLCVDLGGRRIIKKKKEHTNRYIC